MIAKKIERFDKFNFKVDLEWERWSWKSFKTITRKGSVVGSGTGYHWYPSGERCPTFLESFVSDKVQAFKWGESQREHAIRNKNGT